VPDPSPTAPIAPIASTRRRWLLVVVAGLAAAALAGVAVWALFLSGDAPSAVDIEDATGAIASPTPPATAAPSISPDASASEAPGASEPPAGEGTDGTWTVDTSVGSFEDFSSSWAGFRVDEVLGQGIGRTTAVGRTPGVAGSLEFRGTVVESASVEVDLTRIVSDRARRDGAIQRSLDTATFPTAMFLLTEPLDLGGAPTEGTTLTGTAVGELTIHGVNRPAEFAIEARLVGDVVAVVGSTAVVFSDFGVRMPSAPIVVSVEDDGIIEVQLFLVRG
jgi:polyisoprenoid-binding protein YceI